MSEYVVNKGSWHFKWIAFNWVISNPNKWPENSLNIFGYRQTYTDFAFGRPYNFCMYWRAVLLWPTLRYLFSAVIWAAFLTTIAMNFVAAATGVGVVLGTLAAIVFAMAVIFGIGALLKKSATAVTGGDTFLGTAYAAYKNKFCPNLNYVEKTNDEK